MDLPRVLRIEPISTDRLTLPIHEMFHRKQYDLVKAIDNTKLKLPANLMPNWYKGRKTRNATSSWRASSLLFAVTNSPPSPPIVKPPNASTKSFAPIIPTPVKPLMTKRAA